MSERKRSGGGPDADTAVITQKKTALKLKKPKLYKVLLHNDDFTTMEFVVMILQSIFGHSENDATAIMLHIHRYGVGVGGVYPYGVAEAKVGEVMATAEKAEYPLLCTMEPDEDPDEEKDEESQ
jgi:ATP-dependent Clp protease adaptor protein ClpS